jgi:preprotein translocase subunit YajC
VVWSLLIQAQAPPSPIVSFVPILLIFVIFYFLLFLPMQRQRKRSQQMLRRLEAGNIVVTSGGIIGAIVSLDDDTVVLRVKPDHLKIQVARSSISGLVPEKTDKAGATSKK